MRFRNITTMAMALSGLVLGSPAIAQQPGPELAAGDKLEETLVTGKLSRFGATKSSIPIIETARSISVIDERAFREFGALTVDDTLAYTSGVIGDSFGFSTRGDFAKVRGFTAAEYRDGQQVLFGYYNNTRSDVYFLEQVEVLKGPASVLYGKGTPGGIVNAISKLAGPGHTNELVVDFGSHDRQQFAADLNTQFTDTLFGRVVALYRDSDTQVDHVNDDAVGFMPSITFQNDRTSITAMVEYMDRESDTAHQFLPIDATGCLSGDVDISPASFCANKGVSELDASAYMGHPDFNRYDSKSTLGSVLASHRINDQLEVEGVVRYKDAEVDYRQAWVNFMGSGQPRLLTAGGDAGRTFYLAESGSQQWAVDTRLRWNFNTSVLKHEMVLGVAYQDVVTDRDTAYGADTFNVYARNNGPIPSNLLSGQPATNSPAVLTRDQGIYISDQISVNQWKFNLGLRYDDTKSGPENSKLQSDYALSSSVGVLYAFANGISPYMSYAESFEPVIGIDSKTGKPSNPREGEQFEVGIKYQPPGTSTYITLAWFDIEENNLNNTASMPGASSQQEGVGTSQGVELEAFTRVGEFTFEINITVLDTENANGVTFDSIPEEQISTWIAYQPSGGVLSGFRSGIGARYVGENESNYVNAVNPVRVRTDGYTVFDAMFGYEFDSWDLSLNLRNLTDEQYYSTCLARGDCYPGEERSVVARAAYRF